MRRLLRNWRNPVGLALGAIHAVVVVGVLLSKELLPPPPDLSDCPPEAVCFDLRGAAGQAIIASRSFHWSHESLFVKALVLVDIPAQAAVGIPLIPVFAVLSPVAQSNLLAVVWVFGGSLQWWMLGTWVYYVVGRR